MTPRSIAIPKTWKTFDIPSFFSAFAYPVLGVALFVTMVLLGIFVSQLTFHWWYVPLAVGVIAFSVFWCNMGIGPLHRILQHRAGELAPPAQVVAMLNLFFAMQGRVRDWVNYHSQHHRHSDQPGDPHNPAEGKFWAWMGWILWRDPEDVKRPMAKRLARSRIVSFFDQHYLPISAIVHLLIPAAIYLIVFLLGGSILLTLMLHTAAIIGRAIQFHATTLGVNVVGHMKAPAWVVWLLAFLTGGEAFHEHHHAFPRSILHRPRKGIINRLVDYNGTMLLVLEKLRLARNYQIAPQFIEKV